MQRVACAVSKLLYLAWEPLRWLRVSSQLISPLGIAGAPQPGRRAAGEARARGRRGRPDRPARPGAPSHAPQHLPHRREQALEGTMQCNASARTCGGGGDWSATRGTFRPPSCRPPSVEDNLGEGRGPPSPSPRRRRGRCAALRDRRSEQRGRGWGEAGWRAGTAQRQARCSLSHAADRRAAARRAAVAHRQAARSPKLRVRRARGRRRRSAG